MTNELAVPSIRTKHVAGYRVGSGPAKVVLVHEIFGLNDEVRRTAERLAREGFTVFAVDLFAGRTASSVDEGMALASGLDWTRARHEIRRAARELRASEDAPVGVVGFCMGGALALAAVAHAPELAACVTFYGIPPAEKADLTHIAADVLGHFGNLDAYITRERVDALEHTLAEGHVRAELHRYAAGHGFLRESFAAPPAQLAWHRTTRWLHARLDVGD
jgi:carboxymethylenebutenolidase